MPLKRRLVRVGNSRMISIPSDWLELSEKRIGQPVEELLMEVDNIITLTVAEPDKVKDSDGR